MLHSTLPRRYAVLVADTAKLDKFSAALPTSNQRTCLDEEGSIHLENDCVCCTQQDDVVVQLAQLAASDKYDYLLLASSGAAEAMQVGKLFGASWQWGLARLSAPADPAVVGLNVIWQDASL